MDRNEVRENLLKIIGDTPGLHFRELQRRTGLAVGQLEYHLYQLQKDGSLETRKDGKFLRYFSRTKGTEFERHISFYIRSRTGREVITRIIRGKGRAEFKSDRDSGLISTLMEMRDDSLIYLSMNQNVYIAEMVDYNAFLIFLKENRAKFLDSLASSLINLFGPG
ncbi:MAG: winged helix-turn-helix transcriptional regulator [Candidatus Thermoplasmatota archaeon]|nr:winged helix-turn-helix transcriptional regulator [Candidatus Thermoplasmatota archaeon]MCL5731635.1 winged helix-turn-helix transcriptional regulator [Candidatus Thermoplasmatota archaeon]